MPDISDKIGMPILVVEVVLNFPPILGMNAKTTITATSLLAYIM